MTNQNVPTPTNQVAGQEGGSLQEVASLTEIEEQGEIEEEVSLSSHTNGSTPASTDATPSGIHRLILKSTPAKVFHFFCSVVASLCSSFVGGNYNKEIPYIESHLPFNDGNHGVSAVSSPSNDDSAPSRQGQPTSSSSNQEVIRRANNINNDSIENTRNGNGGLVVSSHQTSSKDPQERLISDCFLHLLSFLPPESIATTEAVSSRWRNEIRSSGSLHQEMNLMRLGLGVPIKDFLSHFRRLSLLAHHRLVKVSLNMSSCWIDYLLKRQVYGNTECHKLFESLLFGSEYSLREVSLVFRLDEQNFNEFHYSFFRLVNSVLQQLQFYPQLESICIEGPTAISVGLQSNQNKSRAFKIKDNLEGRFDNPDSASFVDLSSITNHREDESYWAPTLSEVDPIAEHGARFVGDGASLTQFDVSVFLESSLESSSPLMSVYLPRSKSSLKILKLYGDHSNMETRHLWDFVIECDNLKSLTLSLAPEEQVYLEFPETTRVKNPKLKVFDLRTCRCVIDWKNASNWLGRKLQVLRLEDQCLMTPLDLGRILKNNTRSLTTLELSSISHPGDETDGETVQTSIRLSLPNLKSLGLHSLSPPLFDLFATSIVHTSLQHLSITDYDGQAPQASFDCFLAFVKASSSTLNFITFSHHKDSNFNLPNESLDLKFNQLRDLRIEPIVSELSLRFSTFASEFPQLVYLWSAESASDAFRRKSPLLERAAHPSS